MGKKRAFSNRKHVIVTGGSRGLGLATCQRLLELGYSVSAFSRGASRETDVLGSKYGRSFHFAECDLSDSAAVAAFTDAVIARFGNVYGLVNNSAVAIDGVLATLPETDIAKTLQTNLLGTILLSRICVRNMLTARTVGRLINISSITASRGFSGLSVYAASKAGLEGFTRSLAREVGPRGITVNCVAPGYMETRMSSGLSKDRLEQIVRRTPLRRLATLADVVPVITFLLSEESRFITGQTLTVDGGGSL